MTKLDQVQTVLAKTGGIAKTSDFVAAGISKQELGAFCKSGELERIRQGYYQFADDFSISEAHVAARGDRLRGIRTVLLWLQ